MYLCYLGPVIKSLQHVYGCDYIASVANHDSEVLVLFCCFLLCRYLSIAANWFKMPVCIACFGFASLAQPVT